MNPYIIYGIFDRRTEQPIYIGQTHDIGKRWAQHQCKTRNGAPGHLYATMSRHGIENFRIEPLHEVATQEEASVMERGLIEKFGTYLNGCNMTEGGERPSPDACREYAKEIWQRPDFRALRKRNAQRRRRARLATLRRKAKAANGGTTRVA